MVNTLTKSKPVADRDKPAARLPELHTLATLQHRLGVQRRTAASYRCALRPEPVEAPVHEYDRLELDSIAARVAQWHARRN
jgi:hypothetical protein